MNRHLRTGLSRLLAALILLAALTLLVGLIWAPASASAADWPMIQGTEEGRPDKTFVPFAFLQVIGEGIAADPVEGLEADALEPFNGDYAAFNVLSGDDVRYGVTVRRARVGVRGSVPETDQDISYFLAAEFGSNAATGGGANFALMDASVTFRTPITNIRAGQFKLPLMDETIEAAHVTTDLANYSIVARRLILDRPIEGDVFAGRANGFRDVGIQLFDAHMLGPIELSYALMMANGQPRSLDPTKGKDLLGRLQLSWLSGERRFHPNRDEISVFAWGQWGEREHADGDKTRIRAGGGLHLRRGGARLRIEGVWADGVVFGGRKPPFGGQSFAVLPDATAWGVTSLVGWRFDNPLELDLGANFLDQAPDQPAAERRFTELVFAGQWFFTPRAKLLASVALRDIDAPNSDSRDVERILSTVGPRFSLQATVRF